jgi:outer membrane protein TolC
MMKKTFGVWLLLMAVLPASAQKVRVSDGTSGTRILSLDSCRQMALRNNKQLGISKLKQDVAENARKSARTKYLPHVSAIGTYEFTSEEVSILNDGQKAALGGLGTFVGGTLQSTLGSLVATLPPAAQMQMAQDMAKVTEGLNQRGQNIVDAFRTDTRNIFAGSVVVTQPVFMGGAIVAMNKMADIGTEMAKNSMDARRHATLYQIDQAYWQVVSLHHKKALAESYLQLVKKFDSDVHKMIDEGVATRSDGLSVDVKVNEAEMTLTKVNDGLVLSRMLLNQLCGLPLNEPVVLQDEQAENIAVVELTPQLDVERAVAHRPELKLLQNTVDLSKQATNVLKAGNLPQVALMGGYAVSNPNVMNGFEKKFAGFWHVGVIVRVPIWNWGDVMYKVRASKGATAIATLELDEAREKIELQVNQTTFKVDEANKKLTMAQKNIQRADENLRTANLGFQEGVISPTVVMEAQTAWLQAQSQKIDAEIDVKLSQVDLQKALGTLDIE